MSTAAAPASLEALLDRGDEYARDGNAKAATSFYQAAMKAAQTAYADPRTVARLQQAQRFVHNCAAEYLQSLDQALTDFHTEDAAAKIRLTHALEMLKGQREIFLQEPSVLYYPYLAQGQFYEREQFDWVPDLEAATPFIREELMGLLNDGADFRPYIEDEPNRPRHQFADLNDNRSWSALYIWRDAKLVPEVAARCPKTVEALSKVPLTHIGMRTPSVLFSRLEPNAHIPPHTGMLNCRLVCHLPLIVPPGCWLRVGNETSEWEEGKVLIFDDSIQHEARNPTEEMRIILLFDIWRPELSEEERRAISSIFTTIDSFQVLPDA